ncbi:RodZ domain-containing protein [Thalassotalea sp. ND16A]|uniref:RodZ domain-containing protein n=1 Tax=Thalassotalea sp. ND16A TaxID=1535422 RepID=UPI00051CC543|nr:RodZ domain-containing protein [Thalassotalea sp. ND16A]KGK00667.1 hypothetical protein ND16A_3427 [Thalassotalea sp. ND16A]
MNENKEPVDISDDIEVIGPGQLLRDARIAKGMTESEVAEQLNLRLALIESIEQECFDNSTPKTFIRGYLKNYARLVGINTEDILSSYEMLDVAQQNDAEMKSFSQSKRKQAEDNRLMLTIYFIAFILIALTVIWWWQDSAKMEPSVVTNAAQQEQSTSAVNPTTADDKNAVTNGSIDNNTAITTPTDAQLAEQTETNDAVFEQHMANNPEPADNVAVITSATANTRGEEDSAVAGGQKTDQLVFSFAGDCWVNIFDASGERLAWGIKKADYVMTLNGKAPFSITLGKPELVAIDYNQQAIDMDQFQQGQIAKFTWPKN